MSATSQRRDGALASGHLDEIAAAVRNAGYAVVPAVVDEQLLGDVRAGLYRAQERILAEVGHGRLERAGEIGVLRIPMRYDEALLRLLGHPAITAIADHLVAPTSILHLQNGLVLPSFEGSTIEVFQNQFHMDFPRVLNGYLASVNVFVAIDGFTADNGATLVCPGTHQRDERPPKDELERVAVPVICPPGSLVIFDSTLWHAAGQNRSGRDRLAVNHQFTRSWIKPQVDYVRALGDDLVLAQSPRVQQLLGWYTRVVTSLDDYYRPADERLYRGGQG